MAEIAILWSEHEAAKPYARPFAVRFLADGDILGSIAVSGADLLYYRHFQVAVLSLTGELFRDDDIDTQTDPQRSWLDFLAGRIPAAPPLTLRPVSTFDHDRGRVFHVDAVNAGRSAFLPAAVALDYQECQASIAHQCGCLFRDLAVEGVTDPSARQAVWLDHIEAMLRRPDKTDAMADAWPWRVRAEIEREA